MERWLQTHETSPLTNEKLPHKKLITNQNLRNQVAISGSISRAPLVVLVSATAAYAYARTGDTCHLKGLRCRVCSRATFVARVRSACTNSRARTAVHEQPCTNSRARTACANCLHQHPCTWLLPVCALPVYGLRFRV